MSLRTPRLALLPLLAFFAWGGNGSLRSSSSPTQDSSPVSPAPSVVLITLDTVRADHLGCYGYRGIETPVIDRLAKEGIRFEHAYAQVPLTLPSHTVMMTGTYPMFNGVRDLTTTGLKSTLPTLAEIMRQNGYKTAAFVSSFVLNSMWGLNRGFEVYDDETDPGSSKNPSLLERRGDRTVNRALTWLDSQSDRPFLLWVHLYDPHSPYRPPEPYFSHYAGHLYDGEIAFDDSQLGRLLTRLRELKLYESALIVLTSDHGESLGEHGEAEHGFFIYSATLHVPLILKLPGQLPRSRAVGDSVGLVEIAPTIANLCRIPQQFTRSFQGRPLAGMREGGSTHSAQAVYAESYHPRTTFGWHELRSVITPKYQFIEAPRPELYDLDSDSEETHNLAAGQSALSVGLQKELLTIEHRYANTNTNPPRNPNPIDSEAFEKLRSLGYVADQAPPGERDSHVVRADPKDKIQIFNQILHAGELRSQQRFAESDEILTHLERSDPALYILAFERGETLLNWGKAKESTAEFHKALALNPSFDEAWMALGRADFAIGQNKEAVEALRRALRYNPRNYSTRRLLARVYWREGQADQAEAELARVVSEHPDFAEGRAEHGVALAKVKRYREAITELRAASSLGYRDAVMYYHLGLSYAETGDTRLAIEAYQQAVGLDPNYAAAYVRLALLYRKGREPAKARQYFQKACKLSEEICREFSAQF